jgi:zinc transport system substrate-binding protein
VAVDIVPVHGLVSQVMDGVATPDLVIASGASPHSYAMRPSEARALAQADVVFWIGPLLTPWMGDPIETLAGGALHVALAEVQGVTELEVRSSARFEAHNHDHDHEHDHKDEHAEDHDHAHDDDHAQAEAHDHDHDHDHGHDEAKHDEHADHDDHAAHSAGAIDGHMWLDPRNASVWLAEIARVLSEQDPENAQVYQSNANAAQEQIAALSAEIKTTLAPVSDAPFIVFHDSYQYFEQSFGVTALASVTLSDDAPASAARLAEVREIVAETGAACALAEPRASEGLVEAVSEGAQITVTRADALGVGIPTGPQFYPTLLSQIADRLRACLSGVS